MNTVNYLAKNTNRILIGVISVFFGTSLSMTGVALAANDAYFTISPSTGTYTTGKTYTVQIYETSAAADNTNAVQANLSYSGQLKLDSVSINGPFTLVGQNSSGSGAVNLGIASTTAVSGEQKVAAVTFTAESTGTATVKMTSGSDIDNTSGTSVWNGSLPSANYSIVAPPPPPPPTSTKTTGSTSGNSTSTSAGSSVSTTTPKTTAKKTSTKSSTKPITNQTATTPNSVPSLGSISIRVLNNQGKPVAGAKVVLNNSNFGTTNTDGVVNFSGVKAGTYSVVISGTGIVTTKSTISLSPGQNKLASLSVKSSMGSPLPIVIGIVLALLVIGSLLFLARKFKWNWKFWQGIKKAPKSPEIPVSNSITPPVVVNPPETISPTVMSNQPSDGAQQPQQQVITPTNRDIEPKA